jgi:hypothetical protein
MFLNEWCIEDEKAASFEDGFAEGFVNVRMQAYKQIKNK